MGLKEVFIDWIAEIVTSVGFNVLVKGSQTVDQGKIKALKLNPRFPTLHHILFADDTVLFGKATIDEACKMKEVVE
ncbi:hypothetical protein LINPERPRIM_LOCUS5234, partial [Linum perenne]